MREAARRLVGWLGGWWAEPGPGGAAAWCLGAGDRRRYYEPQMPHMARNIMAGPTVESLYSQKDTALNKRGRFEDLMEERRQSSDLKYAMRCYTPVVYKDLVPRTPSALRSVVLKSDPVQYVVKQLAKETGESTDIINDEAADILEKMGHGLRLSVVRFFAFTLSKIFKALFQKVHVNEEGIQKLHQAIQEYPVVLLPSHRSYIDFLMLSYIMYTYDLSLPVIAAGMDFMGMKIVGEMLRMSGAFFIRRSFGGDRLYWAVFSEYVKTILRNGDAPVEFFVEGTRSRTGKSLMPKLGLLNIAIEPFLMGEVFDMYLIPVSISYDRILEESLYAHELLGVPKPKESTSGLLKARKILSENFGSIHVYFGQPVSVRSLATGIVRRSHYNLLPRHIPRKPSGDVYRFLDDLGHKIVVLQQKNMVISPWVLMATVIIQNLPGLTLSDLTRQTLWLKTIAETFGAFIDWPENLTPDKVIRSNLALHHNIVKTIKNQIVLCQEDTPAKFTVEKIFKHTISVLMCASYRNQILHVFVRPALVAIAFQNAQSCRREDIYGCFSYLREVLSDEFVFLPGNIVKDFDEGLYLLMKSGAIQGSQADLYVSEKGNATISFLSVMFAPFLEGYQVICKYLLRLEFTDDLTEKRFIAAFRNYAAELILSGAIKYNEVLSVDMQKNALAALTRLGAVEKLKIAEGIIFKVNEQTLSRVVDMLVPRMPMKSATVARL